MGIAVDASGSAYVTGESAGGFPGTTPFPGGTVVSQNVFVAKLNPTGSELVYSKYLAGGTGAAIAVDGAGNAFVTGTESSGHLPVVGAFQPAHAGASDLFVAKVNAEGSALVYASYLGGIGT